MNPTDMASCNAGMGQIKLMMISAITTRQPAATKPLKNEKSFYLKIKNFLTFSKSNFKDEYEIQTNTVDKVFGNINLQKALLKIDVEGFEMNVIEGSQTKLGEISFILLENQFGNHFKNNNFKDIIR